MKKEMPNAFPKELFPFVLMELKRDQLLRVSEYLVFEASCTLNRQYDKDQHEYAHKDLVIVERLLTKLRETDVETVYVDMLEGEFDRIKDVVEDLYGVSEWSTPLHS